MKYAQNLFVNYRVINNTTYVVLKEDAFILDEVGQLIWKEIGDGNTLENVITSVKETYKINHSNIDHIEKDIEDFINDLLNNKLIEAIS
ncbi:PqqD family protein [Bacillus thuringiensis]|uniref:PqqD family protein n=1 Tax=Bacillus cereus group TaxID=86661 RepID=UPI00125F559F|nr:PqqD family protein [Bacillus thuringiensis]KAB5634807.1 PqqD family protein [Bacillus thuringiensis]HDR5271544.1 PqqD family protein [Bacillus thuringiensis]